jgi:hypothetical protein
VERDRVIEQDDVYVVVESGLRHVLTIAAIDSTAPREKQNAPSCDEAF